MTLDFSNVLKVVPRFGQFFVIRETGSCVDARCGLSGDYRLGRNEEA